MKTLDDTIEKLMELKHSPDICYACDDNPMCESCVLLEAIQYLKEYRDLRAILPDRLIGYFGRTPVVEVDGFYFGVKEYDKQRGGWRCERVEESSITHDWVCTDDDTYIIDNSGRVLYRLVGWDLRREEYRREDVGK